MGLIYQLAVMAIMLLIIFTGKPEKRFLKLAICTVLIPLCYEVLHMNCFFNTVPHCTGCVLVAEGEEKPKYDANDLKMACFYGYMLIQIFVTPYIIKNNVNKGRRLIGAALIIAGVIFIGCPLALIHYM